MITKEEWDENIDRLSRLHLFKRSGGVSEDCLQELEKAIGKLPEDLRSFYSSSNGLRHEWFNFLPIEQPANINKTWDGIKRANSTQQSRFLNCDNDLMNRFIIIAEIGGGHCACICRENGSIWFQDQDGLHQTTFALPEFIEACLDEVDEL